MCVSRLRRWVRVVLALSLLGISTVAHSAGTGVGVFLSDEQPRYPGAVAPPGGVLVVSRIAADEVCGSDGSSREPSRSSGARLGVLLQLPQAGSQECWLDGLSRLAGEGSEAEVTYLLGERPHLKTSPEVYAYLLKRAAVAIRAADPTARTFVGPVTGEGASWLERLLSPDSLPYVDGIASAPDSLSEILGVRDRFAPGLELWSIETGGTHRPDAGSGATARAARALAAGARVSIVRASGSADLRMLHRFAELVQGDFQAMQTSSLRAASGGVRPLVELIGGPERDARVLVFPPHDVVTFDVGPPPVGRAEVVDLQKDTRTRVRVTGRSGRQRLTLRSAASVTVVVLADSSDLVQERLEVITDAGLTAAEIIAREREAQARQRLELDAFEAQARIEYHFTISNLNESIDVVTKNDAFCAGDTIEYRQRALFLNGHPFKGKPPALPFIAPEKVKEVPLRIALDEGYRYELEGVDSQAGHECYRIAFEPLSPDSADFRGKVWIDRDAFFRVRMDLVRLHPSPPASSDSMTQWFEPRSTDRGEFWLISRNEGQMLLSALGRSIVLLREIEYTDYVVNPDGFDDDRRAAHASDDPMFRDSLEEGLVALRPARSGGERTPQSATTKSNTLLVGGWGASANGDVRVPFAGFNWFDMDFRGTGVQVDLAWAGPVGILSLDWPVPDSPWQVSLDSALSAVSFKDRHTDLTGRVAAEELQRQDQFVQASFRRTLGPFLNASIQPSLGYLRVTRNDSTDTDFLLPPDTLEAALGLRLEYQRRGYELALWGRSTRRDHWGAFGLPGDASMLDVRENPLHYGLQFDKTFYSHRMDRCSIEVDLWGGRDLDRFSAYRSRVFPGLRIRGYDGKGLSFTQGVTGDFRYALPPMGKVRFELSAGGAIFENPEYYGERSQYAYGASLAATFPGAWGTFLRARIKYGIDSSLPVEGSQGSIRLMVFKTFNGWWPWTRASRGGGESRVP
jgi:hypothetical protein